MIVGFSVTVSPSGLQRRDSFLNYFLMHIKYFHPEFGIHCIRSILISKAFTRKHIDILFVLKFRKFNADLNLGIFLCKRAEYLPCVSILTSEYSFVEVSVDT